MRRFYAIAVLVVLIGVLGIVPQSAQACPFCSAVQVTFTEEMNQNDMAVIAKLVARPKRSEKKRSDAADDIEYLRCSFEVVDVLKGEKHTAKRKRFKALYIGEAAIGQEFLVMGAIEPTEEWGAPIELTPRATKYLREIIKLPAAKHERLVFFQKHLEDADALIARDAYDEFATTPYADLKKMKEKLDHNRFVERLKNPKTDPSHRRLYFTLLGICGTQDDIPLLEQMLVSEDREMKTGLDALVACYLTLKGEAGLPLVAKHYIKNENAEFTDQYQAIMALRFHAEEAKVINRNKIAGVLRHMLDRPKYADIVVPDLARWEDWSVVDRLFELYRDASDDSLFIREPVVRYMIACPLPQAKEYLKQMEKIDPKAVDRAKRFGPIPTPKTSPVGEKPNPAASRQASQEAAALAAAAAGNGDTAPSAGDSASDRKTFKVAVDETDPAIGAEGATNDGHDTSFTVAADGSAPTDGVAGDLDDSADKGSQSTPLVAPPGDTPEARPGRSPGIMLLAGAPILAGLVVAAAILLFSGGTKAQATA